MPRKESPPEDRHSRQFVVRFTEAQFQSLSEEARAAGIPLAAYVRQLALSRNITIEHPIVLDATDVRPAVVQLARIGNNLNQIAHRLNRSEQPDEEMKRHTLATLAEVRESARALTAAAGGKLPKRKR